MSKRDRFRTEREARKRMRKRRCVVCRRRFRPEAGHSERCPECAKPAAGKGIR